MRTVVAPMNDATFTEMPRRTSESRYSRKVVQSMSYFTSACWAMNSFFIASLSGPMETPSPNTSSVTPCFTSAMPRPSMMSDSVAQLSMLMKPGATAMPRASISVRPRPRTSPTAAMRSPRMATSPILGAPPWPS
jgi:hypothetical protein